MVLGALQPEFAYRQEATKQLSLRKLDQPGGRASVFRQDGFTFDAGPTIVTAPFLLEELWDLCGRKFSDSVMLKEMSPFYRIRFDDGTFFDYSGNPERMREQIRKFSPNEVQSYDNFMKKAELCYQLGYEDLESSLQHTNRFNKINPFNDKDGSMAEYL